MSALEVSSEQTVFVVRDFSVDRLRLTLEGLVKRPPAGFVIDSPSDEPRGGSVLMDVVLDGIAAADRVLVVTNLPNANVGFEAGIAVGLGKPVLFGYYGTQIPSWTSEPPMGNMLQGAFETEEALRNLMSNEDAWVRIAPAPRLPRSGTCLDLCPRGGEGDTLRRERDERIAEGWVRPPTLPFALSEMNRRFGMTNRLVWTVADYSENADVRDGAENASNAVVAGWFYSRCWQEFGQDRRAEMPFTVLRSATSRPVIDVQLHEYEGRPFGGLEEYGRRLSAIESAHRQEEQRAQERREARPRIAVLTFRNLGATDDAAFSEGLTELLIDSLTQMRHIRTVPKTSVLGLHTEDLSVSEIADKLHADYLLEGTLDRSVDPCRVSFRLIRADDESYVWSESTTESWTQIQRVRSQIVDGIARRLREELRTVEDAETPREDDHPIGAVEQYMRGRHHVRRFNNYRHASDLESAKTHLENALAIDEGYGDARNTLGFLNILEWETNADVERLGESRAAFAATLDLDPRDAFAMAEVGYVAYVLDGDDLGGIERARRATAEDPRHPIAHNVLALLYLYAGFWEANVAIENTEVIPRDPAYVYPRANSSLALQLMADYDKARAVIADIRSVDDRAIIADLLEGSICYYEGNLDEAERIWWEGLARSSEMMAPVFETVLGWLDACSGNEAEARRTADRCKTSPALRGPYAPYLISIYALLGESGMAVNQLKRERTFASSYRYLVEEPNLRSLAGDRGFESLLESRYYRWVRNVEQLGHGLPSPPPALPSPLEFIGRGGGSQSTLD